MAFDDESIIRIARLSRLHITESDLEPLSEELSKIVEWVEQLSEVDTSDVDPVTNVVEIAPHQRLDMVNDGNYVNEILENAPESNEGFFVVKKVIE